MVTRTVASTENEGESDAEVRAGVHPRAEVNGQLDGLLGRDDPGLERHGRWLIIEVDQYVSALSIWALVSVALERLAGGQDR
jgi:hypothetical protein